MSSLVACPQCGTNFDGTADASCPQCAMQIGLENLETETPFRNSQPHPRIQPLKPHELNGRIPGLEVISLIGHGGMGAVYKARQVNLNRIVALKIIKRGDDNPQDFSDRFRREAQTMARLNHPHIVTIYEFGQSQDLFYLVMEYVEGTTLRHLIQSKELNPPEAIALVPEICDALQFAHDQGIVHRDIKPENILVDRQGHARIADFGLAKLLDHSSEARNLTRTGQVMGTPHYMAPEQVEQPWEVDHRADIYSLGVVLYEMLTGHLPMGKFEVPSQQIKVDVRLDEVVLRALEKSPDQRYQLASQVATDVKSLGQGVATDFGYSNSDREKQYQIDLVTNLVLTLLLSAAITTGIVLTRSWIPLYGFCVSWLMIGACIELQSRPRVGIWIIAGVTFAIQTGLLIFQVVISSSSDAYWIIPTAFISFAIGAAAGDAERKKKYGD